MSFPLADWIMDHEKEVAHDLAQSGMKGQLRSVAPCLRSLKKGDPRELRRRWGEILGVEAGRVVLTVGASTANTLVALYLRRELRRRTSRAPWAGAEVPEYPPLWDGPESQGFRMVRGFQDADVAVLSNPNNPSGSRRKDADLLHATAQARHRLVDETFREFGEHPSLARRDEPRTWVTGTFTKAYGADEVRSGFVVAPSEEARAFADVAQLWLNRPSLFSVGGALALLDRRKMILREARGLFHRNRDALRRAVPGVPSLEAPLWFDRTVGPSTQRFAVRALQRGVLVCPGQYFRDPGGVRVCLTSRSFPADLRAYLALRGESPARTALSP